MSSSFSLDDDVEDSGGTASTVRLRVRLHASNLPRQGRGVLKSPPNAFAVITKVKKNVHYIPSPSTSDNGNACFQTDVVYRSCHPQWTETFALDYEYGSQLHFYAHVFHVRHQDDDNDNNSKNMFDPTKSYNSYPYAASQRRKNTVSIGTALFEVGDLLGSVYRTKVKRLRQGGCIICRLEVVQDHHSDNQAFCFQLAAVSELVLPHGNRRNWTGANLFHTEPDTVLQLAKRSSTTTTATTTTTPKTENGTTRRPSALTSRSTSLGSSQPWVTVWRSQPVLNSLRPTWDRGEVDLIDLCHGDLTEPLRISVWALNGGGRVEIGVAETTAGHLLELYNAPKDDEEKAFFLQRSDSKVKQVGQLRILFVALMSPGDGMLEATTGFASNNNNIAPQRRPPSQDLDHSDGSFSRDVDVVDLSSLKPISAPVTKSFQSYVEQGVEIDFGVAIDFTSSNGDPRQTDSYHYQGEDSFNDYEETIAAIGKALAVYSTTQQYSVWGFGAKYGGVCRHLFQCGPQPFVHGVDGILGAYRSVFKTDLTMSGPTEFLQVLQMGAARAKRYHDEMTSQSLRYMVLLIITDGVMSNLEETRRKLEVYSRMPLSVVFVGVGRASFDLMYRLCSQHASNTTFVEFRHHQHNPLALGQAALQNIPTQMCRYMQSRGF